MSCVLRAKGESFDVAAFLASSPLQAATVYEKGDPLVPGGSPASTRRASGFNLTVSEAGLDDLEGQIHDAVEFLDECEDELRRLGRFPGVEEVSLDFGVRWREVAAQTDSFPSDLLWRAGALDLSLEITHYLVEESRGS